MRRIVLSVSAIVILAGCSRVSPTGATPIGAVSGNSLSSVAGQAVSVTPNSLPFTWCGVIEGPKSVTVSTNFAGTISATAGPGCSVSPASQEVNETPGSGGLKSAPFVIGSPTALACTVTFTDKKGNTTTLEVQTVTSGDGSCWV